MTMRLLALLMILLSPLSSAEGTLTRASVSVVVRLEVAADGMATLVGRFTPDPTSKDPLHLYSKDLEGTVGVATRIELPAHSPLRVRGPLTADVETVLLDDLPVYPNGPVTLRLPVLLPVRADGAEVPAAITISYMACSAKFCKQPVQGYEMTLTVPSVLAESASTTERGVDEGALRQLLDRQAKGQAEVVRRIVREELDARLAPNPIAWRTVATVAEVESVLAAERAAGRVVLLDFTGPSCVNCQLMEKTVFRLPAVIRALGGLTAVKVNTDPPFQVLADWQQMRFQSQNRPLYVRLAADGTETRWSEVFAPDAAEPRDRFLAFLAGGAGADAGLGAGLGQFLLLAVLGGLFTLLMPCTYPMIPFTVNFFAKQAAAGHRLAPLATFYALGIVACFVGLGVLITGVFGASLSSLAGHPVTNLLIALLFVVFGLSLLGLFLLRLPNGLENALGGGRAGYLGALVMGLTFAVTAFTCTAPFAGTVLAQAVATGVWWTAVLGMTVYALAIAVPFFFLALSPGMLKRLPKAGGWMNEVKVVGGVIELAAALKFLVICDLAWQWGVVDRTLVLAAWAAGAGFIAIYVLGLVRLPGDQRVDGAGAGRVLLALGFATMALWFAAGLAGTGLGFVESLFPVS